MLRSLFTPRKDPVSFVQEAGWAPGSFWKGDENLALIGIRSPDSPARIQSLYRMSYPAQWLDGTGFETRRGPEFFSSKNFQTSPEAQPTNSSIGTGIISRRIKRPWHEVDFAGVKNEWSYTSAPPICLHGVYKVIFVFMGTCYRIVRKLVNKDRT